MRSVYGWQLTANLCSAVTLVACAAAGNRVSAQVASPDADSVASFPDTPVGKLGRMLIEVINSGDSATRTAFLVGHVSDAAIKEISIAERAAWLARVSEHSGGLEVLGATGGQPLEILVKTRRGNHWARIYAFTDPRQGNRLGDYGAVPVRDPAIERADRWPQRRLPEAEVVREISRHVGAAARRDEFSGVVLVAKGERTIFHQAYGLADRSWRIPNRLDTKFNLASMNKMFTAVAIAQLIEAGKLHLEDTLGTILPDYPNQKAARTITIAHLLSHSAGLGMLFDRPGFDRRKRYRTSSDYFPLFAAEPLLFEPGTASTYSNEGFVVLGAVVEKLTDLSYFDHVRERIFRPLDMSSTDSYAIDDVVPNLAVGYARYEDDPLGTGPPPAQLDLPSMEGECGWRRLFHHRRSGEVCAGSAVQSAAPRRAGRHPPRSARPRRLVRIRIPGAGGGREAGARPRRRRAGLRDQLRAGLVPRRQLRRDRAGELRPAWGVGPLPGAH